jgi:RimJ/RimL family protein N-acetyltransferase
MDKIEERLSLDEIYKKLKETSGVKIETISLKRLGVIIGRIEFWNTDDDEVILHIMGDSYKTYQMINKNGETI